MSIPEDARAKYAQHRRNAATRGIEFNLTFDEWWEIWEPRYENRGRRSGQYVMCRRADAGPYEVGNVRIDTTEGNAKERGVVIQHKNVVRDWTFDGVDRQELRPWVFRRHAYGMDYFKRRELEEEGKMVNEDEGA